MGTIKQYVSNVIKNNAQDLMDTSVGRGSWYNSKNIYPVRDALRNEQIRTNLNTGHHPEIKKAYGFK